MDKDEHHEIEKKGKKRKLAEEADVAKYLIEQVTVLNSTFSWGASDRAAAKHAAYVIADLVKSEDSADVIIGSNAIPALVKHLQAPPSPLPSGYDGDKYEKHLEHEVEKGCAFALGLLTSKPEHQQLIVDFGALPHLVDLLKRRECGSNSRAVNSVIKTATDTITNLAHENDGIKNSVRIEGGLPPLVELLQYPDIKVQRAAARALRSLAFENEENKKEIIKCNALPILVLMLRSADAAIQCEAVAVIGNLVHSSPDIKKQVLLAGALQPVIGVLSSCSSESQREAALLIGQFAKGDSDCEVQIVQRGAVQPLIATLQSTDLELKEMSSFALGRLAQNTHNQAGIVYNGGLLPLLKLLDSENGSLQHNAAFALFGLAENEDNISDFVKSGAVQKLKGGEFIFQATKECVANTFKRLEEKIHGQVLSHLLYLMRVEDKVVQSRVALALAHVCSDNYLREIFIDNNGLELLLGLLSTTSEKYQRDGSLALFSLANKATLLSLVDAATTSPTTQVYLGISYVNNATDSDVTFLVEGTQFYAHRSALLASSDTFRAMFDGGYREKDAKAVEIPNIRLEIFELIMRYIYTGSVDVPIDTAEDLLRAADQYLMEGLKRLCEVTIAHHISMDNVSSMYELSESFNALCLRHLCILFILQHFDIWIKRPGSDHLIKRAVPEIRGFFSRSLV